MAAVVSTGTATDNVDLLQKLVAWLVDRGYTSNKSESNNGGWRAHLNKGSVYVNICASVHSTVNTWHSQFSPTNAFALNLYIGTGYSSAEGWKDQPGGPTQNGTSYTVGSCAVTGPGNITSYQFIDDGNNNIFVIIERAPGIFRSLYWGSLVKVGLWTGGNYFGGNSPGYFCTTSNDTGLTTEEVPFGNQAPPIGTGQTAFVRADIDAFVSKWLCGCLLSATSLESGYTGKRFSSGIESGSYVASTDVPCLGVHTAAMLHSTLSGRIFLLPVPIYAARDAGGYSLLGEVPSLRLCRASSQGMTIGTDVPIGDETWRVFNGFAVRMV